jgi:hypothetical protein
MITLPQLLVPDRIIYIIIQDSKAFNVDYRVSQRRIERVNIIEL